MVAVHVLGYVMPFLLLASIAVSALEPNAVPYRMLHNADGVTVWERAVPGMSRAQFRARTIMQSPAINIAAVIMDVEHTRDWNDNCKENFILETKGPGHHYSYNHSRSPAFFLSERDVVLEYRLEVDRFHHTVRMYFNDVQLPQMPAKKGIVRMPHVSGFYELRELDAVNTEVTYDITADPGGWVPEWIVDWASQRLIGGVMKRLALQVRSPMYVKLVHQLQQGLDWRGFADPEMVSELP